ncbi:MAG: choice-of-anchor B family protein [Gemmatimonadales bacterium]
MNSILLVLAAALPSAARDTLRPDPADALMAPGFAAAVAVVGDQVLVGRARATTSPPQSVGAIHVFRLEGGAWAESASFASSETKLGDGFGAAIAGGGSLVAVGAPRAADGAGAVYLFSRGRDGWTETLRLVLPEGREGDLFGATLDLDGNTLVVGAPGRDSARGAAYAFRRSGDAWGAAAPIGQGIETGDRYGTALDLAGDRLIVGAPGALGGFGGQARGAKPGGAFVYKESNDRWIEEGHLTVSDSIQALGAAVALLGGSAFASTPLADGNSGQVIEFRRQGDAWTRAAAIPSGAASGSRFGIGLATADGQLLVTAFGNPRQPGGVFVYGKEGESWAQRQSLSSGGPFGDAFGNTVATGNGLLLVTAPGADFGEGKVYAFRKDGGSWVEAGSLVDNPSAMTAVTGSEVRCAEDREAAGFQCQNVDLLAFLPNAALGAGRGVRLNDIWGWTDPETQREYALVGRMDGTSFVDITDPSNPRYLGDLPLHEGARPSIWRDIKVYQDHAFIVADLAGQHGMQVFDLRQLRSAAGPPVTFQETANYDKIASAHNIVINEESGYAYPVGNSGGGETCGGALHMIDIRTPAEPKFAGCFADPATGFQRTGYTHDAQCVTYKGPDTRYTGREICFNASENALGIADVTDKSAPKAVASAAYPNVSYAHQGWLSEDHKYFYLDDELDELRGRSPMTRTLVWDISKLDEPVLAGEVQGATAASDHNMYVRGHYLFQSNYVAGLRVLDIADPTNPVEVGYFDTVGGDNIAGFDGSWSNYPYFPSGTIVVTSVREGLFIVRHRPERPVP